MDFDTQLLIAFGLSCAIGIPITLYKYNKNKRDGKSIKYLELKVLISVALPILSIPVLLSNMSFKWKIIAIFAALIGIVSYVYSITSSRRTFRKVLGLPPEDENTGEVIKGDKKEQ